MKDFFSHTKSDDYEEEQKEEQYRKQVFNHFASLDGAVLDYYGADDAEHEFRVDEIIFKVLEDPNDGYRSCLGVIEYGNQSSAIFFRKPIAKVRIETYDALSRDEDEWSGACQGYRFIDVQTGHVWLEFGTDNTDDYYPYFVFRHTPDMSQDTQY